MAGPFGQCAHEVETTAVWPSIRPIAGDPNVGPLRSDGPAWHVPAVVGVDGKDLTVAGRLE